MAAPPRFGLAATTATEMIIAIDGPAASGKGTLGKRLAAHFGLRHLDTGLLYRAVAKALSDAGAPLDDRAQAVAVAQSIDPTRFDEAALKTHAVGEAASIVSAIPELRAALIAYQREFAASPQGAVVGVEPSRSRRREAATPGRTIVPTVRLIGPARRSFRRQPRVCGALGPNGRGCNATRAAGRPSGDFMASTASASSATPSRED